MARQDLSARKPETLPPDPRLRIDPKALGMREPCRAYLRRDTGEVARDLIGAWFARRYQGDWYGARIVETEAYLGTIDAAAHSWRGRRTARIEPMYCDGGYLYVFMVYGIHYCANIVTGATGIPEAVLLRAAEGPAGTPSKLMSGPGKLCKALGVTAAASGVDLLAGGDLHLFLRPGPSPDIRVTPRIGVDYAAEAKHWPLRFFDVSSPAVSGPARLRFPAEA